MMCRSSTASARNRTTRPLSPSNESPRKGRIVTNESKRIGAISAVTSNSISAIFREDIYSMTHHQGGTGIGKVGSYVMMQDGERSIIGSISAVRSTDAISSGSEVFSVKPARQLMDIQLIGTLHGGSFERG